MLSRRRRAAEVSDLSAPENRFEREFGELLEVYTRIETPERHAAAVRDLPAVLEHRREQRRQLLRDFAPVLIAALIALGAVADPARLDPGAAGANGRSGSEKALQRSLDMSDRERRRIAGDLHDGPVQELAGSVDAAVGVGRACGRRRRSKRCCASRRRRCAAASARCARRSWASIRRTSRQAGLGPALADLTSRLPARGARGLARRRGPVPATARTWTQLLYRACQEALRNVEEHAGASHVRVPVRSRGGRAVLEVVDDGRGIPSRAPVARRRATSACRSLADMVRDAGGTLSVAPERRGRYGRARGGADAVITRGDRRRPPGRAGRAGAAARDVRRRRARRAGRWRGGGRRALRRPSVPTCCCSTCRCPTSTGSRRRARLAAGAPDTRVVVFTSFSRPRADRARRSTPARSATC